MDEELEQFEGGALEIHLRLWTETAKPFIYTRVPGWGPTLVEALEIALGNWLHSVFDTVRTGVGQLHRPPDFTERIVTTTVAEELTNEWHVFEGNLVVLRSGPLLQIPMRQLLGEERMYTRVAEVLTNVFTLAIDQRMHWIEVQLLRRLDGTSGGYSRIDNALLQDTLPTLAAFPWPDAKGYLQIWLFRRADTSVSRP